MSEAVQFSMKMGGKKQRKRICTKEIVEENASNISNRVCDNKLGKKRKGSKVVNDKLRKSIKNTQALK